MSLNSLLRENWLFFFFLNQHDSLIKDLVKYNRGNIAIH